jgi:hypothetical protein
MQISKEPIIGVVLQEAMGTAVAPKILSDNGTVISFDATLQDTKPNRNKRFYGEEVLSEAIASPRIQELLRTRSLLGEAGHPFNADMARQLQIDPTRVSHIVTELNPPQGGVVRGRVETASTACGRDMRGLIVDNKATVAFSMRGMGGVRKVPDKDLLEVTKPLALVTYDWVVFPSTKDAYADVKTGEFDGMAPVTAKAAANYARDQSGNVKALVEQFELEGAEFCLTDDQRDLIVKSPQAVVRVFLENDIRETFRHAIARL